MDRVKTAQKSFKDGNSCSQAVFSAYAPNFGMDKELALKISSAFSGGMGSMGLTCGAVTGAFMVIGLKYGRVNPQDSSARDRTNARVQLFTELFRQRNNNKISCNELIGCDWSDEKQIALLTEKGILKRVCSKCVKDAVEIIEEIL
jgi:C_GCAxxG_C_C family probable redox protein